VRVRLDYHNTFWFAIQPAALWELTGRFEEFESWWPWLADFRAGAGGLVSGNVLHATVVPPLPYRLRLDIELQRCIRPRLVEAVVGGDVSGRGVLRLEAAGDGTSAEVAWSLAMRSAPLRAAALVAYPLMRWGHDRVVDMAVSGLRCRAGRSQLLSHEAGPPQSPAPGQLPPTPRAVSSTRTSVVPASRP
jgi:hypothetical protein